ncbi:putative acyl-CoA dehydrogenase fadE25 [Frondihabitans sp. 762G35]|uniref:acyl-CoA dehydrogenase family protein n=1 Tax=Frondihabitans sp. 762G35 TaxID=1446794 RepID=UPI000D212685|nr:acyl-CoA dehydrogenase family protein [Frondihabitans sp. 762G35]ARC58003.1 putative acyl-CoA dehydrogenase fadE25 [Frondihabitans sp. 762G35]
MTEPCSAPVDPPIRAALAAAPGPLTTAVQEARPTSVADILSLAPALEATRPFVGEGATLDVWEALATLGAADLSLARALEPHLDAVTILEQAGLAHPAGSTWGVFAAEGAGMRLTAAPDGDAWLLDGVKPWCSLAGDVSHALVTAWVGDERRLFAVALRDPDVVVDPGWTALGLTDVPSGPVSFAGVRALPVGEPGWYLRRPGFAWGGISVAACWFGGATGIGRTLLAAARARGAADPILRMHVGRVDARLHEARTVLVAAAADVDGGRAVGAAGELLAARVRATVAGAAEEVLRSAAHALGPSPLVTDVAHAERVADLELYVRQHHAERDEAALGRAVLLAGAPW